MQHKDFSGNDLHVAKANTGSGSPVGVKTPSIKGELYTDEATGTIYTGLGTANTNWISNGSGGGGGISMKKFGNVLEYGADPTGVVECTAAVQQCINENNIACFPAGTFLMKTIVLSGNRQRMVGSGTGTLIKAHNGTSGRLIELRDSAGGHQIEDIKFSGTLLSAGSFVSCIEDVVVDTNNVRFGFQFKNLDIQDFTGHAINCTGRSMASVIENVGCFNVGGFGIQLVNVSDSSISNCHVGGAKRNGIRLTDGNIRMSHTKICMSGTDLVTPYAGLVLDGSWYNMITGCEFQQNCFDAVSLINNATGNVFEGCVFDSNNKIDADLVAPNVFSQINVKASPFNRFSGMLIDGRFISRDGVPWNIKAMYGVMVDDKSPYCTFDFTYSPVQYNLVNGNAGATVTYPRFLAPYQLSVNDHTSVYKLNNRDYVDFAPVDVVIGTNATISGTHPTNMDVVSVNGGKEANFKMTAGQALTTGNFFSQKILLTMANFPQAVGKTKMYISYESKVKQDLAALVYLEENSTPHTANDGTLYTRPINVNHNASWMPAAAYKTLLYSGEAGFQIYLSIGINVDVNQSVVTNDILAYVRNIRVSFA